MFIPEPITAGACPPEPSGEGRVPEQDGGSLRKEGTRDQGLGRRPPGPRWFADHMPRNTASRHPARSSSCTVGAAGKVISVVQMRK